MITLCKDASFKSFYFIFIRGTMKTPMLLLFISVVSNANNSFYDVICDESVERGLNFERVSDVRGRFALKWCTVTNTSVTDWTLRLYYYSVLKQEQCNKDFLIYSRGHLHSFFKRSVQVNSNCTNVCFTTNLDAIFSSTCYLLDTRQVIGSVELNSYKQYHYVGETNLTIEDFTKIKPQCNFQSEGEDVVIDWHPGYIVSQYEVYMIRNDSKVKVDMNCSTETLLKVSCRARAADGFYRAEFQHTAPWRSLNMDSVINFHCNSYHNSTKPNITGPAMDSPLWWALGVVGGVLLLGVLALLLQRAARAVKLKQEVLRSWVDITRRLEHGGAARMAERVVLLYARDCAHMERAAQHLAALLQLATGCEVVDLYSTETVAAAAPAPASWLRALLLRAGTRVLLVQSPAAAVYCARLARADDGAPALEAPLLGSRVAWRRPHAADSQLLLALRLLTDAAHHEPLPYKKYYVATVAGLQHSDVVPALTPQRRYLLPHAAELLLRDLAPQHPDATQPAAPPAAAHLLQLLTEALEDFRLYALANPNYLFDDLMFE